MPYHPMEPGPGAGRHRGLPVYRDTPPDGHLWRNEPWVGHLHVRLLCGLRPAWKCVGNSAGHSSRSFMGNHLGEDLHLECLRRTGFGCSGNPSRWPRLKSTLSVGSNDQITVLDVFWRTWSQRCSDQRCLWTGRFRLSSVRCCSLERRSLPQSPVAVLLGIRSSICRVPGGPVVRRIHDMVYLCYHFDGFDRNYEQAHHPHLDEDDVCGAGNRAPGS